MDSKQQYKMDWLSRARQAEHTLATLQVLHARDAQMIQQLEPYQKDCQKLYQRLQQTQEAIKTETIMLAEFREEVWAVISAIPDTEIRNIFLRKYLCYETNEQIAEAMFFDVRTIQRKHKKALDTLIIPDIENPAGT